MSDDELMDDVEQYDFEYSGSEEGEEEGVIDLQNEYYNAKESRETNPEEAIEGFRKVVTMEKEKGEWGFKALKQILKLQFKLRKSYEIMKTYNEFLSYTKAAVTRNYSEKTINNILDYVSISDQIELLQQFYETTLNALKDDNNERLWFKTNIKLGQLMFSRGEYGRLAKIVKELRGSCTNEDGTIDLKKGTQLLEIYALEIQLYTATKNNKKLKEIYHQSMIIKSGIAHPRIMGIIRECGGKMHMNEHEWDKAFTDFMEAFKNYDEAGSPRRIYCLKYLVLASMLSDSKINPFDSPDAKAYKNDSQIVAMTNLVNAYIESNIKDFEKILKENHKTIMDDEFIRLFIEELLKNIRTRVVLELVSPYTRIRVPFISKELNIPSSEVESLLVSLILDSKILGHIDQVNQLLLMRQKTTGAQRYKVVERWSDQLEKIHKTVVERLAV